MSRCHQTHHYTSGNNYQPSVAKWPGVGDLCLPIHFEVPSPICLLQLRVVLHSLEHVVFIVTILIFIKNVCLFYGWGVTGTTCLSGNKVGFTPGYSNLKQNKVDVQSMLEGKS